MSYLNMFVIFYGVCEVMEVKDEKYVQEGVSTGFL